MATLPVPNLRLAPQRRDPWSHMLLSPLLPRLQVVGGGETGGCLLLPQEDKPQSHGHGKFIVSIYSMSLADFCQVWLRSSCRIPPTAGQPMQPLAEVQLSRLHRWSLLHLSHLASCRNGIIRCTEDKGYS